jgi:hypothetical protein
MVTVQTLKVSAKIINAQSKPLRIPSRISLSLPLGREDYILSAELLSILR